MNKKMPTCLWQKMIFAGMTVIITVLLFVFYNLIFINGMSLEYIMEYGVYVFGGNIPLWAVILIEMGFAFTLEMCMGSPLSMKLAFKALPPQENKFIFVETAIICVTVCLMCPAMSLVATFMYTDLATMNILTFLSTWLCTIFKNFPLALFSQLFFIQPFVRFSFGQIAKIWLPKTKQNSTNNQQY